jgi:Carboxypeptidase regulatory-like domain/TonB-dependent Receptor Plug Domain
LILIFERGKPMKRNFKQMSLVIFIAIICGFSNSAIAQDETAATINGQVTDSSGAAVANASVVVASPETGTSRTVQADNDGNYSVSQLIPGQYTITVEQNGFKRYVQNITLNVKDRRQVAIILEVGAVSETVTVTDEPPLIQESPTGQTLINNKQIVEIPLNNRDFTKLLELVPGVSSDLTDETSLGLTNRTSVSINGMRRNGVNYLVDGVNNTDGGSNITLLSTPTIDSIREFKVLTSNFTAEVGRSGSGTVTLVTKGGTNEYRFSLYEFVRNDIFNANTFFNNRRGRKADGTPQADVPRLRYNTFGGTFGGPLPFFNFGDGGPFFKSGKNKTFFFYSQDFRKISRASTTNTTLVPSVAERAGDFSSRLGSNLCLTTAATPTSGVCGGTFVTPIFVTDTTGASVPARQNQIFNAAGRAYAGNVITASDINPVSRALLGLYPLPNTGTNQFVYNAIGIQNTRQEVIRIDHNFNANNSIFGRYTHDLNETQEPGGLFNGILLPNVATTNTKVPGQLLAISMTNILSSSMTNEVAYNFSQNFISTDLVGRGRLSDYGLAIGAGLGQAFPENGNNAIPSISIPGITFAGSTQGYGIRYRSQVVRDNFTYVRGQHTMKFGAEIAFESKNENASNNTQGQFTFDALQTRGSVVNPANSAQTIALGATGIGLSSFLTGRANSYLEDEFDITFNLNLGRHEFYAQDTFRILPNLTLDFGVRYQYFQPATDKNNVLTTFDPSFYSAARTPTCATATCGSLVRGTGDPLNGIRIAGVNSRFNDTLIKADKNNFSPRIGLAYSPNFESGLMNKIFGDSGKSVIRAGYGFYYDQIATFLYQDPTTPNRPFNNRATYTSTTTNVLTFANPTAGALGNLPISTLGGINPDLKTPEIQQYSIGLQREIFKNAVIDVSYVGTKGDFLLRRRDINFVEPAKFFDSAALTAAGCPLTNLGTTNCINLLRPFRGYGAINYIETAARSRYNGLLTSFSYRFAKGSTLTASYTFSKNLTDFTNDRDAVDAPQNPYVTFNEYAEARTSRPHIFSASYVYEIPFFNKLENRFLRAILDGYQIGGITNIESGPPVSRVLGSTTTGGLRGNRANLVGNPTGGLAGTIDPISGLPYVFDPNAFADPALGTFGNSGRAIFRLPGRNQTNLSISRYFYFNRDKNRYLQLRAESFNVFNTTQFLAIDNQIGFTTSGLPGATRLPREFQFAAKLNF